jgi:hypothetical protein
MHIYSGQTLCFSTAQHHLQKTAEDIIAEIQKNYRLYTVKSAYAAGQHTAVFSHHQISLKTLAKNTAITLQENCTLHAQKKLIFLNAHHCFFNADSGNFYLKVFHHLNCYAQNEVVFQSGQCGNAELRISESKITLNAGTLRLNAPQVFIRGKEYNIL